MLGRWQLWALVLALFVAALGGAYWSGWNARGAHEAAATAARNAQTAKDVEDIGKDVKGIDDSGLADRLSRGK